MTNNEDLLGLNASACFHYMGQSDVSRSITAVAVDSSIQDIAPETFSSCTHLTQVDIYGHNLKTIGGSSFKKCQSMKTILFPDSVERIEERAFSACVSLTQIGSYPPKNTTTIIHTSSSADDQDRTKKIPHTNPALPSNLKFLGPAAFHYCKSLTSISIPSTVETIREYTFFYCEALVDLTLKEGLKVIEERAFQGCISLQNVAIPTSVEKIGKYAFFYCLRLTEATLPKKLTDIKARSFHDCKALKFMKMQHTAIQSIEANGFYFCEALLYVDFPPTLQRIHRSAFESCKSLKSVAFPPSLTAIEQGSFRGCRSLIAVELCNGLEWILSKAFADCESLRMIVLPAHSSDRAGEYAKNAFSGCSMLEGRCFGGDLLTSLTHRFDKLPIHKLCYNAGSTALTVEDLATCVTQHVVNQPEQDGACVDSFGMTPLHILGVSAKPREDFFLELTNLLPIDTLTQNDKYGNRPVDYLCQNEAPNTANLIQMVLQRTMLDRMNHWGLVQWREDLSQAIRSITSASNARAKVAFLSWVESKLAQYERLEVLSLLELTLWKIAVTMAHSQEAISFPAEILDRYSCRIRCGAETIIPNVSEFL
ncbi:unnamed protein product [Cylindrotheca closterium]|uniref:Uncharacterized protein n=1 Tax=Cylindrotheca closterium TaxID=2856 RepID=A0AAD2CJD0_9STRA|nr:unnamed protein product [Cylindrotheca closterium]